MNILVISLLYIGIMLFLAKVFEESFRRLGLVTFVGPILIGILLRHFSIVKVNPIISFITSLGIIFLLFLAGAEEFTIETSTFTLKDYVAIIIQVIFPLLLIILLSFYLGLPNLYLFSIPLAMSSAGPLTRLLMDTGLSNTRLGNTIFKQVIYVEIIFVVLFAVFQNLKNFIVTLTEVTLVVLLIMFLGRFVSKILERIEVYFSVREIEFASIIALILIIGYLATIYMFNAAIAAFFLGLLLRDYINDRPEISERLHGFTYGFFEPLFFTGIGLYVSQISLNVLAISFLFFISIISGKGLSGYISSFILKVDSKANSIATSIKGGVDSSLLLSALTLGYISLTEYSIGILAISFVALAIPLIFQKVYRTSEKSEKQVKIRLSSSIKNFEIKPLFATCEESLRSVINKIDERGTRGIVIVNSDLRPIGYISVSTLLEIDPLRYDEIKACEVSMHEVPIEKENVRIIDVLREFRESGSPVIVIVNSQGKLVNTIYERELLRYLVKV